MWDSSNQKFLTSWKIQRDVILNREDRQWWCLKMPNYLTGKWSDKVWPSQADLWQLPKNIIDGPPCMYFQSVWPRAVNSSMPHMRYDHQKRWTVCSQWLLLRIFILKLFETNLNFRYQWVKNPKKAKGTSVISTFLNWHSKSAFTFSDFYWLVPKIEICLKYFLDKNPQKQCDVIAS